MIKQTFILIFSLVVLSIGIESSALAANSSGVKLYQSECSDCHIPYPSNFLGTQSWDALLKGLDNHFGDDAELAPEDLAKIKTFLDNNNYDQSRIKKYYHGRFDSPGTPLRISKTVLFKAIHHEISDRWVTKNPKVKSFSHCDACHRGASRGSFDEDDVRVPRY